MNGFQKLGHVIRKEQAKNKLSEKGQFDLRIELATVQTAPPDLSILIDGLSVPFDKDFLLVAEHLTRHKRTVMLSNSGGTKLHSSSVQDLYPKAPPQESHDFVYIHMDEGDFEMIDGEIEFTDELKPGDRVVVASTGSLYIILDRVKRA